MKLNELQPKEGSVKKRMRVGRGIGSGKGKTAGRGVKGQKSRTGVAIKGFEGGQMPIYRRLPKRGFNNIFSKDFTEINLAQLQAAVDAKKIDPKEAITEDMLVQNKVIRRKKEGVRLLGTGQLKAGLKLTLSGATKTAQEAVKKAGGSLTLIEKKEPADKPTAKKEK